MDKRKIWVSLITIAVIFSVSKLISNKLASQKKKSKPKVTIVEAPLVKYQIVHNQLITPTLISDGKLTNGQQISVALEGKGTLQSDFELKEGATFKKGQKIAYVVDDQALNTYRSGLLKLQQLLSSLMVDIGIEYPQSKDKWQQFINDLSKNILPNLPQENDDRLQNFLSNKGFFNTYYDLKSQQSALTKRNFIVPFDGYIVSVSLQSGSFINGTSKICEIAPLGSLEVDFSIDEKYTSKIQIGQKVKVDGKDAYITRLGRQINTLTQQKMYTARLVNSSEKLSGEFVSIQVPINGLGKVQAFLVPSYCQNDGQVFVIQKDEILGNKNSKPVGAKGDSLWLTGLEENERLVLESFSNFTRGQKVRISKAEK